MFRVVKLPVGLSEVLGPVHYDNLGALVRWLNHQGLVLAQFFHSLSLFSGEIAMVCVSGPELCKCSQILSNDVLNWE